MKAYAKINLALVVGPTRADGLHEVATILQRIDLHDGVTVEPSADLVVDGFPDDTIVADALSALGRAASVEPHWRTTIEKRIPVAAGLGGGSSDAAAALALANATLAAPLGPRELHAVAASIGADVPFFLRGGTQLATGAGADLEPVELPLDYHVVVVIPAGVEKESTGEVYAQFDRRGGADGYAARIDRLRAVLDGITSPRDLAELPANDLVSSPLAEDLRELGALRADVTGAGPAVYGLFLRAEVARRAADALRDDGKVFVARPV